MTNNPYKEKIVGYDARDYSDDITKTWPLHRRQDFLYKLDVRKVLSVDIRVWPTLFSAIGKKPPAYQAGMQYLWANIGDLRVALSSITYEKTTPAFRTIAVSLVADGAEIHHPTIEQVEMLIEAVPPSPNWQLVGYDVADAWHLSALSNCGFLPGFDDIDALRRTWGRYLNEFHLFSDLQAAIEFRHMSDKRLAPDHAPTFVYAIRILH